MRISPIVPEYEPRIISEDERTVILRNAAGQTVKYIKDSLERMPMYLDWPFEVAAGNDAVALRKKYGKDLIIGGTIDKRALIKGKEATREEVMSKVPFLLEQGGYFPSVDHAVPPIVLLMKQGDSRHIRLVKNGFSRQQIIFFKY